MEGNDWEDLFAVVRGSISTSKAPTTTAALRDPFSSLPQPYYQPRPNPFHCYSCPPDPCRSSRTAMQELEELCKPFLRPQPLPQHHHLKGPLSSTSSSSSPQPFFPRHPEPRLPSHAPPRTRRRKNQQKRVVREVPADGLSSDVWAWRKYGQKPIKGSPFPRGYYRCSSSKGCLARKQVERSRKDPNMFVITYTGEHSHPVPTHRNSLAGSTRQKTGSSVSVSRFVKAKTGREAAKVATSSGSEVTVEEKKGGEGVEQVQQQEVLVAQEVEAEIDKEEEREEEEGMVLMRELEMFGEEMMFVGFDDMEPSMGI